MTVKPRLHTLFAVLVFTSLGYAQFTSSVQGVVQDPSGAVVPKAAVTIRNNATQATNTTTTDDGGNFRFLSLPPSAYTLIVEASGYGKSESTVTLLTEQT